MLRLLRLWQQRSVLQDFGDMIVQGYLLDWDEDLGWIWLPSIALMSEWLDHGNMPSINLMEESVNG